MDSHRSDPSLARVFMLVSTEEVVLPSNVIESVEKLNASLKLQLSKLLLP